ncbi:hypothetical protein EZ449_19945 [Pedobacter frigidisoli]|uniref:Outer membrane protein beta-barrel domain-containing protein n=2 Tax=Pedobacter frigidisoli TaxID=2530455 RepID=A0A4R0NJA2_9SPHI|nr:hypothetical protein EZ449_19945 [Pedobacter frigidisoli]
MKNIILVLALASSVGVANAQDNPYEFFNALSGGAEFGAATLKEPLISGFIAYNKPKSYLKLKFSSLSQDTYEVNVDGVETTRPGFSEVALAIGKRVKFNANNRLELGAGVALVADLRKYDESNSNTLREKIIQKNAVGLIGEIKYIFRFVDGVGVSLSINGNLNQQKSFAAAGLGLVFSSRLIQ